MRRLFLTDAFEHNKGKFETDLNNTRNISNTTNDFDKVEVKYKVVYELDELGDGMQD